MSQITIEDKKATTPPGRISHPHLDKASATKGFEASGKNFGMNLLIPKTADITAIKKAEFKAKQDTFGMDKTKWPEKVKSAILDGDKEAARKLKKNPKGNFDEMKGHWVLNLKRKEEKGPPPLLTRDKKPALASLFVAGHYAQACIIAFAFEKTSDDEFTRGGTGFRMMSARYVMKGEPFGQGGDATQDFNDDDLGDEFKVDENDPENYEGGDGSGDGDDDDFDM